MMTNELYFDSQFIDSSQSCADSIQETTGCDAFIINSVLTVLGGTGRYRHILNEKVLNNAVFERVFSNGEDVEVQIGERFVCQTLNEMIFENGNDFIVLCHPMKVKEVTVGAIIVPIRCEDTSGTFIFIKSKVLSLMNTNAELIISRILARNYVEKIELIEQQFEALYSNMQDGIIIIDNKNRIVKYNYKVEDYLKVKNTTLLGRLISDIFPNIDSSLISNVSGESNIIELHHKSSGYTGTGLIIPIMANSSYNGAIVNLLTNFRIDTSIYRSMNINGGITFRDIIGDSAVMKKLINLAKKVAPYESNVVLYGESGTGKELFARAIHNHCHVSTDPFIAVNCAAIPETLIESELWGYEQGAFTGANPNGKPGKFEIANGGTIFLDEISEMPLFLQPKLLRIIQEKKLVRLGGIKTIDLDIRIISATNKNLEELVTKGYFRQDLFYRLNVITLAIPPVRDRKGDIPILVDFFTDYYAKKINIQKLTFEPEAIEVLEQHRWDGNVRELQNFIESLYCMSDKKNISRGFIHSRLRTYPGERHIPSVGAAGTRNTAELEVADIAPITDLVRQEIIKALNRYGDSTDGKFQAARALGISPATLYRKIKELEICQTEKNYS